MDQPSILPHDVDSSACLVEEDTYATPALADGRIYVRTTQAPYAFGTND